MSLSHASDCLATCESCGKLSYASRAHARKARQQVPGHHGLRAYRCPWVDGEVWHLGTNPEAVRAGTLTAPEYHSRGMAS